MEKVLKFRIFSTGFQLVVMKTNNFKAEYKTIQLNSILTKVWRENEHVLRKILWTIYLCALQGTDD